MASENYKTTHQENNQQDYAPSVLLQTNKRGSITKKKYPACLQRTLGIRLGSSAGHPPGLCLRVTVFHQKFQNLSSLRGQRQKINIIKKGYQYHLLSIEEATRKSDLYVMILRGNQKPDNVNINTVDL